MPYLQLKTKAGNYAKFPIYHPKFSEDGYLAFFEAHVRDNMIFTGTAEIQPLVLKRTDMSAQDWAAVLARIGSVGGTGGIFFGPFGVIIGGLLGFISFIESRPSTDGYYLLTENKTNTCVLSGKIRKGDSTYIS